VNISEVHAILYQNTETGILSRSVVSQMFQDKDDVSH